MGRRTAMAKLNAWLRKELRKERDDRGSSIATVLALGIIGAMLVTVAAESAIQDLEQTRPYYERQVAFYAAEAGLAGFLSHINDDPLWIATDPSQRTPQYYPGEMTASASPNWVPVPRPDGRNVGEYTISYTIVPGTSRPPRSDGGQPPPAYVIEVSGRFGNSVRTVQLELERQSFLSFMYFTDYETWDPGSGNTCLRYFYPPRPPAVRSRTPRTPRDCNRIDFVGLGGNPPRQDVLNGPVKSNDSISYCGNPHFKMPVESGRGWIYQAPNCGVPGSPIYDRGRRECGREAADCPSEMPLGNDKLKRDAENGGFVYQGPIEITPLSNGRIIVCAPYGPTYGGASYGSAVATGPAQSRTNSLAPPNYYDPRNPTTNNNCTMNRAVQGQPPPNGVIYVQNWPGQATRPGNVYIATPTRPGLSPTPAVSGRWTVGAENSIYIWSNLIYNDTSSRSRDVIGLIANNSILFGDNRVRCTDERKRPHYRWHAQPPSHPTNPRGWVNSAAANVHEVNGALLALNGNVRAYGITNPPDGAGADGSCSVGYVNGTLRMFIAMAQRYRGAVGTYSGNSIVTGYVKDYNYDERLSYVQPPRFLEPTNANWVMLSWREIPPKVR
jgi:hypothetical protein